MSPTATPTACQLETLLRDRVATNGDVAFHEFCREQGIAASVVQKLFGSWGHLRERIGLPRKKLAPPSGPSNEDAAGRGGRDESMTPGTRRP